MTERKTPYNSNYPKGGVSCSKDSFVVNQILVFQIKFYGKSPALRVAANRWQQAEEKGQWLNLWLTTKRRVCESEKRH